MRSVGIDIGSFAVKMVSVIEDRNKGLVLESYQEKILTSLLPADQNLEIIEFLRTEVKKFSGQKTRFTCSFRQDQCIVRIKEVGLKDRLKILKTLPFELEDDIPFHLSETLVDARVLKYQEADTEVLAVAAKRDLVKAVHNLMLDSGIQVDFITPEGMALGNLLGAYAPTAIPEVKSQNLSSELLESEGVKKSIRAELVIHMGYTQTLVGLFEKKQLIDIRSVQWGAKDMVMAIEKKYAITRLEAEKQFMSTAFILTSNQGAHVDQVLYSEVLVSELKKLVQELRLTILEFKAQHHAEMESVKITGGGSRIQNLTAFLTQHLELAVNRLHPFQGVKGVRFEENQKEEAVFALAYGLALEGLRKSVQPAVSLLRGDLLPKKDLVGNFINQWGLTAGVFLLLYIGFSFYASTKLEESLQLSEFAKDQVESHFAETTNTPKKRAKISAVNNYIRDQKKEIEQSKKVMNLLGIGSALDVFKNVSAAMPKPVGLEVKIFKVQDTKVLIEGFAQNPADIERVGRSLKGFAKKQKVDSKRSQLQAISGKVSFAFEFETERNMVR